MIQNISKKSKNSLLMVMAVITAGSLLNAACNYLVELFSLPFFLDSIFTIMVTAFYGLFPGILTGLFTNICMEIFRGYPGYLFPFAIVNICTAMVTYLFVRFDQFHKVQGLLWSIITLALVNSLVGAVLVAMIFGGVTNEPVDGIVQIIVLTGHSICTSAFLGRVMINLADKGIAVLIVFPLYRYSYLKKQKTPC